MDDQRLLVGVGDDVPPARAQDPDHLAQGSVRILNVLHHPVGEQPCEAPVGEGEPVDVGPAGGGALRRRGPAHGQGPVETDASIRSHREHVSTGPASDVEHPLRLGHQLQDPALVGPDLGPPVHALLPLHRPRRIRAGVDVGVGVGHAMSLACERLFPTFSYGTAPDVFRGGGQVNVSSPPGGIAFHASQASSRAAPHAVGCPRHDPSFIPGHAASLRMTRSVETSPLWR